MKKIVIIAALFAMMTAAYAQIQPGAFITCGKTAVFTGISTDSIVVSTHTHAIQKKHSHKNTSKSRTMSLFAAEEDNKDEIVICPAVYSAVFTPEYSNRLFSLNNDEAVYKVKSNLTILKTRK